MSNIITRSFSEYSNTLYKRCFKANIAIKLQYETAAIFASLNSYHVATIHHTLLTCAYQFERFRTKNVSTTKFLHIENWINSYLSFSFLRYAWRTSAFNMFWLINQKYNKHTCLKISVAARETNFCFGWIIRKSVHKCCSCNFWHKILRFSKRINGKVFIFVWYIISHK